jgi:hypothetical protein
MSVFEITKKSNTSAYITMGNITVYLDNSTDEQIVHIFQDQPLGFEPKTLHNSWTHKTKLKREVENDTAQRNDRRG